MIYFSALRPLVLVLLLGGTLASCRTKTTTNEEVTIPTDTLSFENPEAATVNSDQSVLFNRVLGASEEGIIRGIQFGDPISKVKATETFEMFEDSIRHTGFTFETEQLETIDVLYHFTPTGRKVNKITVDVYLNSEIATRQFWNSAKRNFTERFGAPQEDTSRQIIWEKAPVRAIIREVSVGKDFGLKLIFEPTDKTLLATR
jgi:hypothetical protein